MLLLLLLLLDVAFVEVELPAVELILVIADEFRDEGVVVDTTDDDDDAAAVVVAGGVVVVAAGGTGTEMFLKVVKVVFVNTIGNDLRSGPFPPPR